MNHIEIHCCATEKSIMSFPLGALCIKTAINQGGELPKAQLHQHYIPDSPSKAAEEAVKRKP